MERKLALNSRVTLTNVFRMPIAVAKEYSAVPLEAMVMLYTYRSSTSMVFLFMLFWNTMYCSMPLFRMLEMDSMNSTMKVGSRPGRVM